METRLIKQKLHEFIDTLEDKRAEEIYELLEGEIDGGEQVEFSDEFWEEMDRRHQYYLDGGKTYSAEEVHESIQKILDERRK